MPQSVNANGALAIANYDFRPSGTVAKSIQIAGAAHAAGLPVELWAVREDGPLRGTVPADVPVVIVAPSARSLPSRSLDLACAVPALSRELLRRRPALLLSGGNHFHLASRAALALSGVRAQVRYGVRASNSSRHGAGASGLLCRHKYAGADFIAAVSGELADEVRSHLPGRDVECIPNGCDTARVRRLAAEEFQHPFFDSGGVVITAMGRLTHQKGFDTLVRALPQLRRRIDARVLFIGHGPAAGLLALRQLAARSGVEKHVGFLGYVANPFAVIRRSHLFACSSRWEGSCNALLEALACGVRVVATDCPTGNGEMLLGGELGELVPPGSPGALAAAISRELRRTRPPAQRAQQLARLDIGRCMESWSALLQREYRMGGSMAGARLRRA